MRRQRVALETEGAYPDTSTNIDVATYPGQSSLLQQCGTEYPWVPGRKSLAYANGLRTALHGCLQVTGSYCSRGESGFSFNGV